jgi:hypothetical protein
MGRAVRLVPDKDDTKLGNHSTKCELPTDSQSLIAQTCPIFIA